MYLKEPKKKKRANSQTPIPLPLQFSKKNDAIIYTAHLGVSATCIVDHDEMIAVHSMGSFGKGSLSRSLPTFGTRKHNIPPFIKERQWKRRKQWLEEIDKLHTEALSSMTHENSEIEIQLLEEQSKENTNSDEPMEIVQEGTSSANDKCDPGTSQIAKTSQEIDEVVLDSTEDEEVYEVDDKIDTNEIVLSDDQLDDLHSNTSKEEMNLNEVLVMPDSDSDTENYLTNIKPRIEIEGFPVSETLQLTFEETFFLMFGLGCLQLINFNGKLMSIVEAWRYFNNQDHLFFPKYVVYHYFRSKGWVVKPGIQFGADFLLYKQGPSFYHASFIVIVETIDGDSLLKIDSKSSRNMNWSSLTQMNRLSETAAKELLIAQVLWPSTIPISSNLVPLEALSDFTVREILWRRWKPNQNSEVVELEEEDDSYDDSL
ncbi:tRNA-splicing endonuclease subunit Sen2 [Chelonus insularis]|uniref:tRNA-splicing endonuclease subunit Sen2 n=1 Tax=Chelonus insularis TaxID=460826 RepID=UPI00158A812B|nr:tRNA-splicing endonuclease subunit Sen2 [Chelonus insularis]